MGWVGLTRSVEGLTSKGCDALRREAATVSTQLPSSSGSSTSSLGLRPALGSPHGRPPAVT